MLTVCLFLFLPTGYLTASLSSNGPLIKTPSGKLLGWEDVSREGRTYEAYTSVPYGKPPVGRLRLRAPERIGKWLGVYNATGTVPICMHTPFASWKSPKVVRQEDCLYLDVYRPKEPKTKSMPVYVYMFGGANMINTPESKYHARYLMDEDIVLVEPMFRVSSFGLLSLGDDVIPGNFMYKDIALALQWVKDNIGSFGGNPNRVIVFGESSGAAACHGLINSPLTKDLVHGAVSHSGLLDPFFLFPKDDSVIDESMKIIQYVGCERRTSQEMLECLQSLDAEILAEGTLMGNNNRLLNTRLAMVVEPKTVKGAFMVDYALNNLSSIPFINSANNGEVLEEDEQGKFAPQTVYDPYLDLDQHLTDWLNAFFDDQDAIEDKVKKIKARYFPGQMLLANFSFALAKFHAEAQFTYPWLHNTKYHNGPVWAVYMEYKTDMSPLATYSYNLSAHAMNMDLLFDRSNIFPWSIPESPQDKIVSKRYLRYFVNFGYHLNPTPAGSPLIWPRYPGNNILRIRANEDVIGDKDFRDEMTAFYYFWEDILGWA